MIETAKTTVTKLDSGMQVEADIHGMKLLFDEPVDKGGDNLAPTPGEVMLASLGACQTMTAWLLAPKMRLDLRGFSVELEADFDSRGKRGIRPGALEIRYRFHIVSSEPQEKLEKLAEVIERHCPVGDTIGNGTSLVSAGIVVTP